MFIIAVASRNRDIAVELQSDATYRSKVSVCLSCNNALGTQDDIGAHSDEITARNDETHFTNLTEFKLRGDCAHTGCDQERLVVAPR